MEPGKKILPCPGVSQLMDGQLSLRFDQWKLVEGIPNIPAVPFVQKQTPVQVDVEIIKVPQPFFPLWGFNRQYIHLIVLPGMAYILKRAGKAVGLYGCALQGSKLDHCLVMGGRVVRWDEPASLPLKLLFSPAAVYRC